MSWTITPQTKVPVDPYRSQVSLLLHGDGANGSTTITDSSPTPKTISVAGNAQISTAQSKFGGASIAFDGNGDYLTVPNSSDFAFGSSSFTIEFFVRFSSLSGSPVLVARRASSATFAPFIIYWNAATVALLCSTSGSAFEVAALAPASVVTNTWHHVAAVRNGTSFTCYLDGIGGTAVVNSSSLMASSDIVVVGGDTNVNQLNGYIDDLRITKGVARYETGTGANAGKMVFAGTNTLALPTAPFPDI